MASIPQLSAILILATGFVLAQTDNSQGPSTDTPKAQNQSSQASNSTTLENEKPKPGKKVKAKQPKKHNSGQNVAPKETGTTPDDRGKGTMGDTGDPKNSDQTAPSQHPLSNPPPKI
jgi:hypothetical protein